jgi:hypothetical protein
MHALVRFAQIPAANTFSTGEIHPYVVAALGDRSEHYTLAALRYDLSKLRAKGLVEKLPRSRRYRLSAQGYSVCLIFLKLFDRVYAPLTAGLLHPFPATPLSLNTNDLHSIASTSESTMALTACYTLSASPFLHPSTRTKSSLMPP